MNTLLWILQFLLGIYFFAVGVMHFIVPPGLPAMMAWMYELTSTLHKISGAAEILGGLGLILPSVTKIQPRLTPLASVGLALVMVGALVWHVQRGEFPNIGINVGNIVMLAFLAYGRWKLAPIAERELDGICLKPNRSGMNESILPMVFPRAWADQRENVMFSRSGSLLAMAALALACSACVGRPTIPMTMIAPTIEHLRTIDGGEQPFDFPYDIDIGPDGRVYLLDTNNQRIRVFDQEGGPGEEEWLLNSQGFGAVAVDPDGNVLIVELWADLRRRLFGQAHPGF